jgi:pyruvate formate lyase activating enzyme
LEAKYYLGLKMVKKALYEALFWHKERNGVRCEICARRCFIPKGKVGFCGVRKNIDNELFVLNFGKVVGLSIDPIEKKPLFHFYPGSKALSFGSPGCNFSCNFCINYELSKPEKPIEKIKTKEFTPDEIVELAEKEKVTSIAYTFTEPTIFYEFMFRCCRLARRANIKNVVVTNGYMGAEAAKKIVKYLDAVVVDFKASGNPEFYKKFVGINNVKPIFDFLKLLSKHHIHIEISDLIIPKVGDDLNEVKKLAQWISSEISAEVPFHILRFFPSYKLLELPETPVKTLEKAFDVAKETGLRFVYIGNVPGHKNANTYCFNCGELLIKRHGFEVKKVGLVDDRCQNCGMRINLVI